MIDLTILSDNNKREPILLAEIAALLHNIGKLDPNFLARQVTDQGEAQWKVEERLLDIPHYCFDRFAAPDPSLLLREKDLITSPMWSPEQKQQLIQDLRSESDLGDEFISSCVEAAEGFRDFLHGNGPLFRCFSPERKQRLSDLYPFRQQVAAVENELDRLNQELSQIHARFDQVTDQQRKQLGLRSKRLQEDRERLTKRRKQKEEAFKTAHQQFEQKIPEEEKEARSELEGRFRRIRLDIAGESWALADLLTLFWDRFFYQPPGDLDSGYKRRFALTPWLNPNQGTCLPARLILSHGEISGAEKEELEQVSPSWQHLRFATAFGYERDEMDQWALHNARHRLLDLALQACAVPLKKRNGFVDSAREVLEMGLGDTQWPINEINLWDYSTSIATLFKAAVAKAVLENGFVDLKDVKWRLLSIRYDGLRYLAQAHHLSDLLARRDLLIAAHEQVQALIEVEYPLGNEVYRDENGAVLVVPHLMDEDGQDVDLLALPAGDEGNLTSLIEARFGSGGHNPLQGELQPLIALSQELPGKGLRLHQAPGWIDPPLHSDPAAATQWWREDENRQGEVCTVCGLRPMGYGAPDRDWQRHQKEEHRPGQDPLSCEACKAQSRNVCWVCMERRENRSRNWAENENDEQTRTIWTDEVADANGRFALLVGRFDLGGWLDGTLISTMQKPDSFARIRRCWETTRQFWDDVEQQIIPRSQTENAAQRGIIPADQRRLRIVGHFIPAPDTQGLGPFHIYELDVEGVSLSAVWVPQDKGGYFLTADNLGYVAKQLGATRPTWRNPTTAALFVLSRVTGKHLVVNEPSGYSAPASQRGVLQGATAAGDELPPYTPHIPILAQPSTFIALVPADKAVAVAQQIKAKYEAEMGKVRDRLPLHLGLVFAPRRTPLRAVLEAGRAMLDMGKEDWQERREKWTVLSVTPHEKVPAGAGEVVERVDLTLAIPTAEPNDTPSDQLTTTISWSVPTLMGDGRTYDQWYPHFLIVQRGQDGDLTTEHVTELGPHQQVWVRPSTFDFVFLDTTGRRFDLNYAEGRRQRFYLEQLNELETLWSLLAGKPEGVDSQVKDEWRGLTNTQIHGLNGLIEAKRREWNVVEEGDPNGTFDQWVRDILARAKWPAKNGWARLGELTGIAEAQERLVQAGVDGTLTKTVELHSRILKLESHRKEEV